LEQPNDGEAREDRPSQVEALAKAKTGFG